MVRKVALGSCLLFSGCVMPMPMHSFSPYTTPEGVNGWRLVYRDYEKVTVAAILQNEMGKSKTCPNGWVQTSEVPAGDFTMLEGTCK